MVHVRKPGKTKAEKHSPKRKKTKSKGYPKDEISIFYVPKGQTLKQAHKERGRKGITFFRTGDNKALARKTKEIMRQGKK
jgi:hypothetical protein